jgi:hypothetical protein
MFSFAYNLSTRFGRIVFSQSKEKPAHDRTNRTGTSLNVREGNFLCHQYGRGQWHYSIASGHIRREQMFEAG